MPLTPQERKERARWSRILRVYGLTENDYRLFDLGYCPICLREWSDSVRPCIDHDHKTGFVRGILCFYCNHRVIGRHREHGVLYRAASYLENHPRTHIVPKKKRKKKRRNGTKNV